MPIDASLTPRRCALLMLVIVGILCLMIASFLSDLRIDAIEAPDDHVSSTSTQTSSDDTGNRRFSAEKDTGPYPGYYMQHLHWFVQVRDFSFKSHFGKNLPSGCHLEMGQNCVIQAD